MPDTIKKQKKPKIKTETQKKILVLSGGSIKGIAHIGVLKVLEEKDILKNITTFAGTSVGGVIAVLYLIGYTPDEIFEFIKLIDLDLIKNINFNHFLSRFGLDDGKNFIVFFEKLVCAKGHTLSLTLSELFEKTGKNLILTTTCVNEKKIYYLNHETHPSLPVITALRMTTAIPFIIEPIIYEGKTFIDGAIMDNYPIALFDKNIDEVIGVYLNESRTIIEKIDNIESFVMNMLECLYDGMSQSLIRNYDSYTIVLLFSNINMINYDLDDETKEKLFMIGYNGAIQYFNNLSVNKDA